MESIEIQPIIFVAAENIYGRMQQTPGVRQRSFNEFVNEALLAGLIDYSKQLQQAHAAQRRIDDADGDRAEIADKLADTLGPQKAAFVADVAAGAGLDWQQFDGMIQTAANAELATV